MDGLGILGKGLAMMHFPAFGTERMSTMFLFAQLNLVVSMVAVGVAQCLLRIDSSRLALSLAFFRTRNMFVSTGTHILFINDWLLFAMNHCRHEDAWFMIEA